MTWEAPGDQLRGFMRMGSIWGGGADPKSGLRFVQAFAPKRALSALIWKFQCSTSVVHVKYRYRYRYQHQGQCQCQYMMDAGPV